MKKTAKIKACASGIAVFCAAGFWIFQGAFAVRPAWAQNARTRPTQTPRPDQSAWVEGRVFDALTKKPLAGAEISLEVLDDLLETTSDAQGKYRFAHVTPNRDCAYSVSIAGYSPRSNYAIGTDDAQIEVPERGLRLDFGLVGLGKISGQVRDSAGKPVAGAHVQVLSAENDRALNNEIVETDKMGRWSLDELRVPFQKGATDLEVIAFDPRLSQTSKRLRVRPFNAPKDEARVALTMPPRAVISGRLTKGGRPLANAGVLLDQDEGVGFFNNDPNYGLPASSVATDKNGRYHLLVSAPQTFRVTFYEDDSVSQVATIRTSAGRNSVLNRDLKPFPYGSLSGRILDLKGRPVRGASIELWTRDTSETEPVAETDKSGRFFVAKVAPRADYRVSVSLPASEIRSSAEESPVSVRAYRTTRVEIRADTVAPRLRVLAPPRVLRGVVALAYVAGDNQGVQYAQPQLDGHQVDDGKRFLATDFGDSALPRHVTGKFLWNSRRVSNGRHRLSIEVQDRAGNVARRQWWVWIQNNRAPAKR